MKELVKKLNNEQKDLLIKIGYFGDDLAELEELVAEYLTTNCFDKEYVITKEGEICESILELISEI